MSSFFCHFSSLDFYKYTYLNFFTTLSTIITVISLKPCWCVGKVLGMGRILKSCDQTSVFQWSVYLGCNLHKYFFVFGFVFFSSLRGDRKAKGDQNWVSEFLFRGGNSLAKSFQRRVSLCYGKRFGSNSVSLLFSVLYVRSFSLVLYHENVVGFLGINSKKS